VDANYKTCSLLKHIQVQGKAKGMIKVVSKLDPQKYWKEGLGDRLYRVPGIQVHFQLVN